MLWAAVTVGLAVVGILRLGSLGGRLHTVEHNQTIIHEHVQRIELCSTARSCQRLLNKLIQTANSRRARVFTERLRELNAATPTIGKELAKEHQVEGLTRIVERERHAMTREGSHRPAKRKAAPGSTTPTLAPLPPAPAPNPAATATPATSTPTQNPAGHEPPGRNKGGEDHKGGAELCVEAPLVGVDVGDC